MQLASLRFSTALWWSGLCAWVGIGVATMVRAQSMERLLAWSLASAVFLVAFGVAQRLSKHSRFLSAVQSAGVIAMVGILCNGYEGLLLVLVAAQLGHETPRLALTWVMMQTVALGIAVSYEWTASSALLLVPPYLGFQFLMYALSRMLAEERATRLRLEEAHQELLGLQTALAQKSRSDERLRMTQELHDVFGHRLTALSLNLEAMAHETGEEGRAAVRSAQSLTRLLLDDVKTLVLAIKDELPVDLVHELQALARDLPTPRIHLECPGTLPLRDPRFGRALLRCAQEIITNAIRHGTARNVWLFITVDDQRVNLLAYDDGMGASGIRDGFGLAGMRRRIEELGGVFTIVGPPTGRVEIRAELPLTPERPA